MAGARQSGKGLGHREQARAETGGGWLMETAVGTHGVRTYLDIPYCRPACKPD
ncbi:MAG TPA: hypothetical protein PK299_06440 [Anaerolineales bacterium]|nr:hypothetical protein [Anaerolineales bacterium]